jgi:uncharacterized membrane protein
MVDMMEKKDSTDQLLYALSYPIGIVGLILILTKKESRDARYHGYNGLFLLIVSFIINFIPILGQILWLGVLIYSIVLAVEVYNGKYPVIPVLTDFASKYVDPPQSN